MHCTLSCSQDMVVKFAAMNSYDLLEASEKAVSVCFVGLQGGVE